MIQESSQTDSTAADDITKQKYWIRPIGQVSRN